MPRAAQILAVTTAVGLASSLWLYLDNRALRADLEDRREQVAAAEPDPAASEAKPVEGAGDPWGGGSGAATAVGPLPKLPEAPSESRMERRARRTEVFAARFGRLDGETDEEYRARMLPLMQLALAGPRMQLTEMRRVAEEKAKVTAAQSAELDRAFEKVYDELIDYTNKAIGDGQLSPYERNVAGWLDFAGGLGGLLTTANGQIGQILQPGQVKAMSDAGFEWGEYLGVSAPWERLNPPPPPPPR
jgi:hypothetical protein